MRVLLDIYRFLLSYSVITARGGFPERFLNLCNKEKIYLWDVTFENKSVKAKIYCKDFFKLKGIRRKCGVKIKIQEKKGLIFLLRAHKKRRILLYGMMLSMIFMCTMNQFVWFIDVKGTEKINKAEVIGSVKQLGLDTGTFVPLFDQNGTGRDIVNLFDGEILWASVNIKGSKAVIELREYTEKESEKNSNENPCNIVADFDGVIVSNETYNGISCTKKGSAVRYGDILISGISENSDGSVNFHTADGKLSARHKTSLDYTHQNNAESSKLTESSRFDVLNIFSLSLPLSPEALQQPETKYQYTENLKIDNHIFPFAVTTVCNASKTDSTVSYSEQIIAVDRFTEYEYERMKNTMIINADYYLTLKTDSCLIKAEYECVDFIGKKSDILKEN